MFADKNAFKKYLVLKINHDLSESVFYFNIKMVTFVWEWEWQSAREYNVHKAPLELSGYR